MKCPEEIGIDRTERYKELITWESLEEIICFQYQRMMRYGGNWHIERRDLLPGHIFLLGTKMMLLKRGFVKDKRIEKNISLTPFETLPFLRTLCLNGNLIAMSQGIIKNGKLTVLSGPLKGQEKLIRKIDRHKRIAEIEIPFAEYKKRVIVGLEIYEKQM